jgi:hypothetical protein
MLGRHGSAVSAARAGASTHTREHTHLSISRVRAAAAARAPARRLRLASLQRRHAWGQRHVWQRGICGSGGRADAHTRAHAPEQLPRPCRRRPRARLSAAQPVRVRVRGGQHLVWQRSICSSGGRAHASTHTWASPASASAPPPVPAHQQLSLCACAGVSAMCGSAVSVAQAGEHTREHTHLSISRVRVGAAAAARVPAHQPAHVQPLF